jgi:hypothetical protein
MSPVILAQISAVLILGGIIGTVALILTVTDRDPR